MSTKRGRLDSLTAKIRGNIDVGASVDPAVVGSLAHPGKMGLFDDGLTYVADDGLVPGSALATAGAAALLDEPIHEAATAASSYVVVTFNYNPAESNSEPLEWEGAIELLTVQGHPGSAWLSGGGGTEIATYAPAVEADWPVVPTTLGAALDAIAARLTALEP